MNASAQSVVWKRHDLPGHEACRVTAVESGWTIDGVAVLVEADMPCRLDYRVDCDRAWVTRTAEVRGWVGDRAVDIVVSRSASGHWQLNGATCDGFEQCVDVDLNFSPSTNMLPVRRLELEVGASAMVRAAWLRFPSFTLELLEQSYTRVEECRYRYESGGGRFVAEVTVDEMGLVVRYGELWSREGAG